MIPAVGGYITSFSYDVRSMVANYPPIYILTRTFRGCPTMTRADPSPGSGFRCVKLQYETQQFNYCCTEPVLGGSLPMCPRTDVHLLPPGDNGSGGNPGLWGQHETRVSPQQQGHGGSSGSNIPVFDGEWTNHGNRNNGHLAGGAGVTDSHGEHLDFQTSQSGLGEGDPDLEPGSEQWSSPDQSAHGIDDHQDGGQHPGKEIGHGGPQNKSSRPEWIHGYSAYH